MGSLRRPVVENRMGPLEHALAIRREAVKPMTALDDRDAQFLFELPDASGERWLRDVTGLRARVKCFSRARATRY